MVIRIEKLISLEMLYVLNVRKINIICRVFFVGIDNVVFIFVILRERCLLLIFVFIFCFVLLGSGVFYVYF